MLDIMALAFWTDSTRVSTFMFANAVSGRDFSFIGVKGGHHENSHHEDKPEKLENYKKINLWHVAQFATLLGVSVRTLQGWEQGRTQPSGAARTLLAIALRSPQALLEVAA